MTQWKRTSLAAIAFALACAPASASAGEHDGGRWDVAYESFLLGDSAVVKLEAQLVVERSLGNWQLGPAAYVGLYNAGADGGLLLHVRRSLPGHLALRVEAGPSIHIDGHPFAATARVGVDYRQLVGITVEGVVNLSAQDRDRDTVMFGLVGRGYAGLVLTVIEGALLAFAELHSGPL